MLLNNTTTLALTKNDEIEQQEEQKIIIHAQRECVQKKLESGKKELVNKGKKLYLKSSGQQFFFIDGPYNNWVWFKKLYEGNSFTIYEMMKE